MTPTPVLNIGLEEFVRRVGWFGDRGQRVQWSPILQAVAEAYEDPECRTCSILTSRRGGKSTTASCLAALQLITRRNAFVVWIAATLGQSSDVFIQKFANPLRQHAGLRGFEFQVSRDRVVFPRLGSTVVCVAPQEASVVGRTLSCLICDEMRSISEETIEVLRPSILGVGKMFCIGSAGRPKTLWHRMITQPGPGERVSVFAELGDCGNPSFDESVLRDIEEDRKRAERRGPWGLALWLREWRSEFTTLSENPLLLPAKIEAASMPEVAPYDAKLDRVFIGCDLSISHDLTTAVALARRGDGTMRVIDTLIMDPVAHGGTIPMDVVEARVEALWHRYSAQGILVDRFQGIAMVQSLRAKGAPIVDVPVTSQVNQEAFEALAEAINDGRLTWVKNQRLESELLGLELRETLSGFTIRDGGSLHRDLSFSLALVVNAAVRSQAHEIRFWRGGELYSGAAPSRSAVRMCDLPLDQRLDGRVTELPAGAGLLSGLR